MSDVFTCERCGRTLPIESFHKAKDRKSGHMPACRECMNVYYAEMRKKNRDENIERAREKEKAYYHSARKKRVIENSELHEKKKQYAREYYYKNKEKIKESKKWVRKDDPESDLIPISGGWGEWNLITRGVQ